MEKSLVPNLENGSQNLEYTPAHVDRSSTKKGEQIVGTREESQRLVAQRLLARLQYPEANKSSANDLTIHHIKLRLVVISFGDRNNRRNQTKSISFHDSSESMNSFA